MRQMSALSTKYILGCEIQPSKKKRVSIEDHTVLIQLREKVRLFSSFSMEDKKSKMKEHLIELGGLRSAFRNNILSNSALEETY